MARFAPPEDAVAFARQIRDPDNHKFSTPSGKIEIYSMKLAETPDPYGLGRIAPIPTWIPPVDPNSPYPLLLCSAKSRARTHSIHGNQPRLARVDRDDVWMNPADAGRRGIADGDLVRVFNEHGETRLKVRVTDRILQGVVTMKEGAWFAPNAGGADRGGSTNVLTADRSAPSRRHDLQHQPGRDRQRQFARRDKASFRGGASAGRALPPGRRAVPPSAARP